MKDIFIDAQIANKFAAPPNEDYKKLIRWLLVNNTDNPNDNAILMISDKLIKEYRGGNNGCADPSSIAVIINVILIEERYKKIKNNELNNFIKSIPKRIIKDVLLSNKKDWYHFPLVFSSTRKVAIIQDKNFKHDLENFTPYCKGVNAVNTPIESVYL